MKPFAEYRKYLASEEYHASMCKLLAEKPAPAREEYPLDVSDLVRMHSELGDQLLKEAVDHFNAAIRIKEELKTVSLGETE